MVWGELQRRAVKQEVKMDNLARLRWWMLGTLITVALVLSLVAVLSGSQWQDALLNFGTEMAGAAVTYDYNGFYNVNSALGTNTQTADPLFVDGAGGDYTLSASSPWKSAGNDGADIGPRS